MRYYQTQPKDNTAISTKASEPYDTTTKVTDKAKVLGHRLYNALQNEIERLHKAEEKVVLGIESVLQELGYLYQLMRQNKMQAGMVVAMPYGDAIIPTGAPYRDQAGYASDRQNPFGLVYFSRKRKGGGYVVDKDKFERPNTKKQKGKSEKKRQQERTQLKAEIRRNYIGKHVPEDLKQKAHALGISHSEVKGVYW